MTSSVFNALNFQSANGDKNNSLSITKQDRDVFICSSLLFFCFNDKHNLRNISKFSELSSPKQKQKPHFHITYYQQTFQISSLLNTQKSTYQPSLNFRSTTSSQRKCSRRLNSETHRGFTVWRLVVLNTKFSQVKEMGNLGWKNKVNVVSESLRHSWRNFLSTQQRQQLLLVFSGTLHITAKWPGETTERQERPQEEMQVKDAVKRLKVQGLRSVSFHPVHTFLKVWVLGPVLGSEGTEKPNAPPPPF